jgi:hypothetical protein
MTADRDRSYVDAQAFTDLDTYIYEAVATLEYSGRPVTRGQIAAVTDLDDRTVGEVVDVLTEHGVLEEANAAGSGEPAFALARRDWSAAPETPAKDH